MALEARAPTTTPPAASANRPANAIRMTANTATLETHITRQSGTWAVIVDHSIDRTTPPTVIIIRNGAFQIGASNPKADTAARAPRASKPPEMILATIFCLSK